MQAKVVLTSINLLSPQGFCPGVLLGATPMLPANLTGHAKVEGMALFQALFREAHAGHTTVSAKGIHSTQSPDPQNLNPDTLKGLQLQRIIVGAAGENHRAEGRRHEARRPAGHWSALFDEEAGGQGGPLSQTWNKASLKLLKTVHPQKTLNCLINPNQGHKR